MVLVTLLRRLLISMVGLARIAFCNKQAFAQAGGQVLQDDARRHRRTGRTHDTAAMTAGQPQRPVPVLPRRTCALAMPCVVLAVMAACALAMPAVTFCCVAMALSVTLVLTSCAAAWIVDVVLARMADCSTNEGTQPAGRHRRLRRRGEPAPTDR